MAILNLRSLGVTLGTPLFTGLDLTLNKADRVGLVAANGRGKSTLLSCMTGAFEPTEGEITRARGLRIGHLEQHIPDELGDLPLHALVLSALSAEQAEEESWRVDIVLDDLNIPQDHRQTPLRNLSGGWQRLAMLARVWVTEPDLLLMDEPTNHLDLVRIGLLERWIGTLPRDLPMVIASHDRAFLDAVTNRTLFLRAERSRLFPLPFSHARIALDEADAADGRQFDNDMKKAAQLRRQAAKLKNIGINSGSDLLITKTKQLKDRAAKLEDAARPAHADRTAGAIRLTNSGTHAKALVSFEDAQISTPDDRVLFKTGQAWINQGDRIVLLGRNGTGKTRLMTRVAQVLRGANDPEVRATPSIVPGISDQGLSQLDGYATPLEAITHQFDLGDQRARAVLAGAGMSIDMQNGPLVALSGGQKARLAMVILRLGHPNFYLLDEPTNHLDIEGQEMLEAELLAHEATCLLVSHDRSFVRAIGNRFWQIERNRLIEVESPEQFFSSQSELTL
ncbi:ABC-F family ATP-binding cassette domain-containing protein [Flavimaricola marinus]|uniref:Putative ABC transporter ATP-binding protein YheS n=1 Tax=Flavimaricola marinus TaxID=1819565 RepID=A0A238LEK5_9RHOB|nr:ABC-F family ATP-binding cassette domain-containing protein [Flavimaricola marinus]SMY08109.1 putative ABC transporter ATP-binding protein YheS [Flavimaricola marinus]